MAGNTRKEIQLAVDQYIALYDEQKKLRDQLETLRGIIEPYMDESGIDSLASSDGRARVEVATQERPTMNARYTTYDLETVSKLLSPSVRKRVVVEVIDKDKLEALCKLGDVSADVLSYKVTKPSNTFSVRYSK